MKVLFHKNFKKKYKKLSKTQTTKVDQQLVIFITQPFDPRLNNHALLGKYKGSRSINITGDLRAIYQLIKEDTAYFIEIGNHSNLYS